MVVLYKTFIQRKFLSKRLFMGILTIIHTISNTNFTQTPPENLQGEKIIPHYISPTLPQYKNQTIELQKNCRPMSFMRINSKNINQFSNKLKNMQNT